MLWGWPSWGTGGWNDRHSYRKAGIMWAVCSGGDAPQHPRTAHLLYTSEWRAGLSLCGCWKHPHHLTHCSDSQPSSEEHILIRPQCLARLIRHSIRLELIHFSFYSHPAAPSLLRMQCPLPGNSFHTLLPQHPAEWWPHKGPPETSGKEIDDVQSSASQTGTLAVMRSSSATTTNIKHYPGALVCLRAPGAKSTSSILKQNQVYNEQQWNFSFLLYFGFVLRQGLT